MTGWRRRPRVLDLLATSLAGARLALAVPVGYLTVLTVAAWAATVRPDRRRMVTPRTRFAVIVPAHDEEVVIGTTLRALSALDYPRELYHVHVVADHCTDATADIARAAGVAVHEHQGDRRGKGPALEWIIRELVDDADGPRPDVVVIVDADTLVDAAFLRQLEPAFSAGAQAVQGQYRVADPGHSPATALRAAALASRHHLRPLGRTTLGGSCGLYGNGMAFRSDLLRRRRWSNHLTEDIEFQMELLLDGVLVAYAPRAIIEAEMPATLEDATSQNERWERGRVELARRYVPRLLRAAATGSTNRVAAADAVLDHVVPPLSVLTAAVGSVTVASSAVALARGRRWGAGFALCGALAVHVVSSLGLAGAPRAVYLSLLHAPSMIVWKVRLWMRTLTRPAQDGWVRTARRDEERAG